MSSTTKVKTKNNTEKFAWYDMTKISEKLISETLDTVTQYGYKGLVVTPEQAGKLPNNFDKVAIYENKSDLNEIKKNEKLYDIILLESDLFEKHKASTTKLKTKLGVYCKVTDMETLEKACSYLSQVSYLIVDFKDDTKIPLELVLAEEQDQDNDVKVITRVADGLETEVVFGVLEQGSHGVLFNSTEIEDIITVGNAINDAKETIKQELTTLTVTDVKHLGMGERACIDTCTYLGLDEGILVGSFSDGGILVCSETHPLPYMPLRPFRVNAGAIHSYAMGPNNRTAYLSDLKAGMELIAVNKDGKARKVPVGRIKIEKRPLIQISAVSDNGQQVNLVLQEDWHVRVFATNGDIRNVTTIKNGDKLLGYAAEAGRHVGIPVDEWILEQ